MIIGRFFFKYLKDISLIRDYQCQSLFFSQTLFSNPSLRIYLFEISFCNKCQNKDNFFTGNPPKTIPENIFYWMLITLNLIGPLWKKEDEDFSGQEGIENIGLNSVKYFFTVVPF